MRSRAPTLAAALLLFGAIAAGRTAIASALDFAPCTGQPATGCATLTVPLDRTGAVPGTVSLAIRRHAAGAAPTAEAVVGLAGGPGQAAIPVMGDIQTTIAAALATRDLIVFDQRGTGSSDPLQCPSLMKSGAPDALALDCALALGPARGSFTTADSVADLEAIRQATGYDKLVLFGVSYGTKVALEYAERYPQHVARLVLDSVVDVNGPDPFQRSTFAAVPRVLGDLCGQGACAGVTSAPTADIAALVRRMEKAPLRGHVFDGAGRSRALELGRGDLLGVLVAGDENPALRALLPPAAHSALHHDSAPLLRLALLAAGLTPDSLRDDGADLAGLVHRALAGGAPASGQVAPASGQVAAAIAPQVAPAIARQVAPAAGLQVAPATGRQVAPGAFNVATNVTTTCEELSFPWSPRSAPAMDRATQAARQAAALPASAVAPFDQLTALLAGPIPRCLRWPVASPDPPAPAPVPSVPTLILSGAADLRTPTEDAQRVAAEIPGAQVFVAANTGHSVAGTDLSGCVAGAVTAFFADAAAPACTPRPNPFRPTPVPPTRLDAIRPTPGVGGRPGRTLASIQDALIDLRRQIIGAAIELGKKVPVGGRFGGLRGGRAEIVSGGVRLDALSYVPGVTLTGAVPVTVLLTGGPGAARLRIGGSAAAHGLVRLSGGRASGALDGHGFRVALAVAAGRAGTWRATLSATPGLARVPLGGGRPAAGRPPARCGCDLPGRGRRRPAATCQGATGPAARRPPARPARPARRRPPAPGCDLPGRDGPAGRSTTSYGFLMCRLRCGGKMAIATA